MSLSRNDYSQVNVINPGCLKVLPKKSDKEKYQTVAIGDDTGILQCFRVEKREAAVTFKTPAGESIRCMVLGGPGDSPRDKIFIARGTTVEGYTKQGKQFLTFGTNLAEAIRTIYVEARHLVLCGNYTYNHFVDCKEADYLRCNDTIASVVCLPLLKDDKLWSLVGCEDKTIQMVNSSNITDQLLAKATPSALQLYNGPLGQGILVGCNDGLLSMADVEYASPSSFTQQWHEVSVGNSPVVSLATYDIFRKGVSNILAGRADGSFEVYDYDETNDNKAVLDFSTVLNESVSAVAGGYISHTDHPEALCGTYAGWIIGFTADHSIAKAVSSQVGRQELDRDMKAKVSKLQKEITEIEMQVKASSQRQIEKIDKYSAEFVTNNSWENDPKKQTLLVNNTTQQMQQGGVLTAAHLSLKDQLILNKEDGCYMLSVESQVPLDCLILHCDTQLDLIDTGDRNSAILSFRNLSDQLLRQQRASVVSATYRCQAATQRLEIKLRSFEGFSGTLIVYVIGRICPKTARLFEYQIKPLSLHQRIHDFDETRPANVLSLTGNFTLSEMHAWIFAALPEVPENPPSETEITLTFASVLVGSQLRAVYSKGKAEFRSDSVSTISVLKEFLTKEATRLKKQLDVKCDIDDNSVEFVLKLLQPLMVKQLELSRKMKLIEPIKELIVQENGSIDFLSKEFRDIMRDAEAIKSEYNKWPEMLKTVKRMHTDLFADAHKFSGQPLTSTKNENLLELLNTYNFDRVLTEFRSIGDD